MSRAFGETLREAPAGIESAGHQMLLRAGYVRQVGQGIFAFLPLGWRALQRIATVLREEIEAIGGVEVSLPVVHPAELWRTSGRYWSVGAELARFADRRDRGLVLAMTHEEVVALLAAGEIRSHRQLPRLVYQIQTKWRDDPRPRAGLIRTREFTMKDSYSLDADQAGLDRQYEAHFRAYERIFARCGLPVIAVGSDVGMMGGSAAHEFVYLSALGEDTIVLCDSCGNSQNRQVAVSVKLPAAAEEPRPLERVHTPGATTIEALAEMLDVPASRTAKVVFVVATEPATGDDEEGDAAARLVVAVVRGDCTLNENKLANLLGASQLRPMTAEEIAAIGAVPGSASPIGLRGATVVADRLVAESANLVAGANEEGWHLLNSNPGRDYRPDYVADIAAADADDACTVCGAALRTERGVEVGNIFKLGTRYSAAFGASFRDAEGNEHPVVMGSYGIGLGRLLACVAEEHHDERGLCLPVGVAPHDVHLVSLAAGGGEVLAAAERCCAALGAAGVDVLFDDRGERAGVSFADADLIGLPLRVTVSERSRSAGGVEVRRRSGGASEIVSEEALVGHVQGELALLRAGLEPGRPHPTHPHASLPQPPG
jgi:prolyl-tRNA synthetase